MHGILPGAIDLVGTQFFVDLFASPPARTFPTPTTIKTLAKGCAIGYNCLLYRIQLSCLLRKVKNLLESLMPFKVFQNYYIKKQIVIVHFLLPFQGFLEAKMGAHTNL